MTTNAVPATIDERVMLTLAKREHEPSHWIEGEYPLDARPDALFAAFEAAGWSLDPVIDGIPDFEPMDMDTSKPFGQQMVLRGYRVKEFALTRPGTGLFNGWTGDEATANLAQAREILASFGFADVPVWAKTWQDML